MTLAQGMDRNVVKVLIFYGALVSASAPKLSNGIGFVDRKQRNLVAAERF